MTNATTGSGIQPLIVEALLLSADATSDTASRPPDPRFPLDAVERGWSPLGTAELGAVPGLADGVQRVSLGDAPDPADPARTVPITSAAHVYEGALEGERTVAIAFRGTDEGPAEFLFQATPFPDGTGIGWDLYQQAHAPLVAAALDYAERTGAERVLIAGHSLGGAIAELSAQRGLPGSGLEGRAVTVTYGNPGPEAPNADERADGLSILNFVHSDDLIPLLGERSPLLAFLGREGEDVLVDRPEGSLAGLPPLDTSQALFAATTQQPENLTEHNIGLYLDTVRTLTTNERVVPGVAGEDAPDRVVLGGAGDDRLVGGRGDDVLIGRGGNDLLRGLGGDDGLAGGPGNDFLDGGRGHNRITGGGGVDVALFRGSVDDYSTSGSLAGRLVVTSDDGRTRALLTGVEIVQFGDAILEIA